MFSSVHENTKFYEEKAAFPASENNLSAFVSYLVQVSYDSSVHLSPFSEGGQSLMI